MNMAAQKRIICLYNTNIGIIIAAKRRPKLEYFYKIAGVLPGTYASSLIESFYNFFLGKAIEFKEEYNCYYREEYKDIFHFLYHKYGMSHSSINALKRALQRGEYVAYSQRTSGRNWPFQDYMELNRWSSLIIKSLNAIWVDIADED
jgi:hypothetical protein